MIKRFISYYKPHIKLFYLDMFCAFIAGVLSIFFPFLTRRLLIEHIPGKDLRMVLLLLILMLSIYIVKSVLIYIRVRWGHILGVRMEYDMRADIFRHIQKLSFTYFDNTKTGHIMSRISNDLNMIAEIAHHAPEDLLISVTIISGAFIFMFSFNFVLALIALVPIPLMLIWGLRYGLRMRQGFRDVRKKIADINSQVENSVQGIREVKSYAKEALEINKFHRVNSMFKIAKERMYCLMAVFFSGMTFLRDIYYLAVVAGGVYLIYSDSLTIADLLAFILYIGIILPPIDRLINFIEQFQQGIAAFERFTEVMDVGPDIQDKKGAYALSDVKGRIDIQNVSFSYKGSREIVLKNINISIDAGETVAFVGESGAGKSTLASLVPRFYEPDKGRILIDSHNVSDLKQRFLRENIGIVQQDVFLFDDTIRENILYGDPDASDDRLIEALKHANIHGFIEGLPDKMDTLVGERGTKLSGGQKQRISIARVFLKNPPILIFDEATSSLDNESEELIHQAMFNLSKGRTTIIIAHRLSTVKNVNRIFVMKNGQIVEIGDHETLLINNGYYAALYDKTQF